MRPAFNRGPAFNRENTVNYVRRLSALPTKLQQVTYHGLKKKIILSNHVFIQFEKYPSTPPNKNKQKSPGGQVCSSPEFQRKVNDILVIIKVAINQNYLPKVLSLAFSQYKRICCESHV